MIPIPDKNSRSFLRGGVFSGFRAAAALGAAGLLLAAAGCFPQEAPRKIPTATTLPDALRQTETVEFAHLSGKTLTKFPDELARCPKLWKLGLRQQAKAVLPEDFGTAFARLRWLDIAQTSLRSLPPSFGALAELEDLYLSDNMLESLPVQVCELPRLRYLNLDRNPLASLPPEIGKLANLRWLRLNGTRIAALPDEIAQCKSLERLYLRSARLESFPEAVTRLPALQRLDLSGNAALASVPDSLCEMSSLTRLDLHDCPRLSALPAEIGRLKGLRWLNVYNCNFGDEEKARIRKALPGCEIAF